MHFPFLVADLRSGLQYRPTDSTLAELSLAPLSGEWAPGRVIMDAPDPVWADSLANAPGETIAAVSSALEDLVLSTPDLRPPAVDQLPDSRARRHMVALVNLWARLGDALPPGLAPVQHVLGLPEGRFLDPLPVVMGSLDQHAPAVMRALYARLEREFGSIETTASPHVAHKGSRLQALEAGIATLRRCCMDSFQSCAATPFPAWSGDPDAQGMPRAVKRLMQRTATAASAFWLAKLRGFKPGLMMVLQRPIVVSARERRWYPVSCF